MRFDKNFTVDAILVDLYKAFDCIPYDLIIAKLATYKVGRENLRLVILKGRKQCVKIIDANGEYNKIISGYRKVLYSSPFCSSSQLLLFRCFLEGSCKMGLLKVCF